MIIEPQLHIYDPQYGGADQTFWYGGENNKVQAIAHNTIGTIPINSGNGTIYIPPLRVDSQNEQNVVTPCKCCKKNVDCSTRTVVMIAIGQYNITTYLCAECSSDFKDKIENELGEV